MKDVPLKDIAEYAAEDADITLQLKHILQPILKEQKIEKLFNEVEIPLVTVLADVESAGVKINPDALKEFSKQLDLELLDIEKVFLTALVVSLT